MMTTMTTEPASTPCAISPTAERAPQAGQGLVRVESVNGRSVVVRDRATSPLKLICPRRSAAFSKGMPAWVYTSGYGGGLVAGDTIALDIKVGNGANAILTTQASTKVYHQQDGRGAKQIMTADVADNALLTVLPDPLVCYAEAIYDQTQTFDLHSKAGLVLLDWLTSGRGEITTDETRSTERWSFKHYRSRNTIRIDGEVVAIDDVLLDDADGPIDSELRAGRFNCLASVFLVGQATLPMRQAIDTMMQDTPIDAKADIAVAYSGMAWGGVLRVGGGSAQDVSAELRRQLSELTALLGVCPWTRKW